MTLAVFGGIGVFGFVLSAISDSNEQTSSSQIIKDLQPVDKLSGVERESYMRTCVSESGEQTYCQCTLDYLEDNYSVARIRQMGNEVTGDSLPPELWQAIDACIDTISNPYL